MQNFNAVGFTGSRNLQGSLARLVAQAAGNAHANNLPVLVGCARGADAAVRQAAPAAQVFNVANYAVNGAVTRHSFARRSGAMVKALASHAAPVLVAAPVGGCPAGLAPSAKAGRCFAGYGSGSWATAAYAAGLTVPVFFVGCAAPVWWGGCFAGRFGGVAGFWFKPVQQTLF